MDTFITFMFWMSLLNVLLRSLMLVLEHPRKMIISVSSDTFDWMANAALLAWVSWLKYGQ